MTKFKGSILICETCGKNYKVPPSRAMKSKYCSVECAVQHRMDGMRKAKIEVKCEVCGKIVLSHQSHAKNKRFCSYACHNKSMSTDARNSIRMRGRNNPMWGGGLSRHSEGYVYEHAPYHPYASKGYVFQHRLVMETYLREVDPKSKYLIKLGDTKYIRPEFVVHHKDLTKDNNKIENLEIMTHAAHLALHRELHKEKNN